MRSSPVEEEAQPDRIFRIEAPFTDPFRKNLFSMLEWPIERLLLFHHLNKAYADVCRMRDKRPFLEKVLERLNVRYELTEDDLSRLLLPKGPVIVVANHPFGGIEGIILASLLQSVRCDVKFMANYLLERIPEIRDMLISVDPFKSSRSARRNIGPLRECIKHVKNGGMLVVFPAGEVSHLDIQKGVITDPQWNEGVGRIIRKTGAPALPVFFQGANSALFQVAGLFHPSLRTAMLPAELLNKGKKRIQVSVGNLIRPERLSECKTDEELTECLRVRTYLLEHRADGSGARDRDVRSAPAQRAAEPVVGPVDPDVLAAEVRSLPGDQALVESGDNVVFLATMEQVPRLLFEIGRLRELTFREVGEGTGRELDLDRFDEYYHHIFIWNRVKKEVVGAYRLGQADEIAKRSGTDGLYTGTLFAFKPELLERLGPALELGRSFVRPEYQKSYSPLLLLWKGIGRYVADNPRYRTLFGPVSITNWYRPLSRHLMVRFLEQHACLPELARLVSPRNPHRKRLPAGWDDVRISAVVRDMEDLSDIVSDIDPGRSGVPILLKQYLKLGGKLIGFNTDPAFGNVLDGLVVVDLASTDRRILERYLGREGTESFLNYHHGSGLHDECA